MKTGKVLSERKFRKLCFLTGTVGFMVFTGQVASAQEATYDGTNETEAVHSWINNYAGRVMFVPHEDVSGNIVTIDYDGNIPHYILGGVSENADTNNNTVILENGSVQNRIYGAYSRYKNAEGNKIITNGEDSATLELVGAASENGNVTANSVIVNDGTFWRAWGGYSNYGDVVENTVDIYGGTFVNTTGKAGSIIYGGGNYSTGNTIGNAIYIHGGTFGSDGGATTNNDYDIIGGLGLGDASENAVHILDGIFGKDITIYGGYAYGGSAEANTVFVAGGVFGENTTVFGGYGSSADGNVVMLTGGNLRGATIYGGYSEGDGATGNIVSVYSNENLDLTNAALYGAAGTGAYTDNTLLTYSSNITMAVASLAAFQKYEFYLGEETANAGTVYSSSDLVDVGSANDATVLAIISGSELDTGSYVKLIENATATDIHYFEVSKGFLYDYDAQISQEGSDLVFRILDGRASDESGAFPEGRAGSLAYVNRGADLLEDLGLRHAFAEADSVPGEWVPFGAIAYGKTKHDSGSGKELTLKGTQMLTGVARKNEAALYGICLEHGAGNYSENSWFGVTYVRMDGDVDYTGGGIVGRYDFDDSFYLKGFLRVGRAGLEHKTDLYDDYFTQGSYDKSSTYYGAYIGAGWNRQLDKASKLEFTSKYFYTHLSGEETYLSTGDLLYLESASSNRWRNGVEYTRNIGSNIAFYGGIAYEYEFSGKAGARVGGYATEAPSLKGGTGIIDLGVKLGSLNNPRFFDIGLLAYTGQIKGVAAKVEARYTF